MVSRMELSPKVLLVSNQQTTGPLLAFSLQEQQQLDVILESVPLDRGSHLLNEQQN